MAYDALATKIPTTNYVHSIATQIGFNIAEKIVNTQNIIASSFDSTVNYDVNDYVIYNHKLYKCITTHSGDWNASNFEEKKITDIIKNTIIPFPSNTVITDSIRNIWG